MSVSQSVIETNQDLTWPDEDEDDEGEDDEGEDDEGEDDEDEDDGDDEDDKDNEDDEDEVDRGKYKQFIYHWISFTSGWLNILAKDQWVKWKVVYIKSIYNRKGHLT